MDEVSTNRARPLWSARALTPKRSPASRAASAQGRIRRRSRPRASAAAGPRAGMLAIVEARAMAMVRSVCFATVTPYFRQLHKRSHWVSAFYRGHPLHPVPLPLRQKSEPLLLELPGRDRLGAAAAVAILHLSHKTLLFLLAAAAGWCSCAPNLSTSD